MRNRHLIIILATAIVGTLDVNSSEAAIFNKDNRIAESTRLGSPYAAIGVVARGWPITRYTTGTLISPCHVVTAQHLFGQQPAIGRTVSFTAAIGSPDEMSSAGTVVAAGGYDEKASGELSDRVAHDWMVVKLDHCLGKVLGFAKLRVTISEVGELTAISSAGYPIDRSRRKGLTINPSCAVRHIYALVWLNDCAALPGNSGGPIFRAVDAGGRRHLEIYAIQSRAYIYRGAIPFTEGYANIATPASMFAKEVEPLIAQSIAASLVH